VVIYTVKAVKIQISSWWQSKTESTARSFAAWQPCRFFPYRSL